MKEWKNLEIDNLPINPDTGKCDILTGDYEFEYTGDLIKWEEVGVYTVLRACQTGHSFRYRKPEPKQPTHEEIWTKVWKIGPTWQKVHKYKNGLYYFSDMETGCSRDFFTGRESADDIPPEE